MPRNEIIADDAIAACKKVRRFISVIRRLSAEDVNGIQPQLVRQRRFLLRLRADLIGILTTGAATGWTGGGHMPSA